MLRYSFPAICVPAIMVSLSVQAQDQAHSNHASPYAGLETRRIMSLSEDDVAELTKGAGWGLALPAELNGIPGPSHLLAQKDEIGLSAGQVAEIQAIFAGMKTEAIAAGDRFIAAEEAIDKFFAGEELDLWRLRSLVDDAAEARGDLRFVHLSRHLSTPRLLTDEQIRRYKVLRGYTSAQ